MLLAWLVVVVLGDWACWSLVKKVKFCCCYLRHKMRALLREASRFCVIRYQQLLALFDNRRSLFVAWQNACSLATESFAELVRKRVLLAMAEEVEEEKAVELEKAVGFDKQTSIELVTKYDDSNAKKHVNRSRIPQVGLGTWKSAPNQVSAAVEYALRIGYGHIDW